jgi:hypothetical protein
MVESSKKPEEEVKAETVVEAVAEAKPKKKRARLLAYVPKEGEIVEKPKDFSSKSKLNLDIPRPVF